jgi:hypothetical protein
MDTPLSYSTKYYWRVRAKNAGGYGPWSEIRAFTVAVGTARERELEIPAKFALYKNYPNPFNSSTTIAFDLAEPEKVSLTIFDVTGRPVARLVDEMMDAGRYARLFDRGALSSGLYIYRLTAGPFTDVGRMLVVR